MRKRLFSILESAQPNDRLSRAYDILMIFVIFLSLYPLCIKTESIITSIIDTVTVSIFFIDYILRFATADIKYPKLRKWAFLRYPFSFMAIVDLLSILPSIGLFSETFRILKVFRLFRSLKIVKTVKAVKVFKLFRYSKSIRIITNVIKEQKEALLTVAGLAFGYIFLSALVIFNVEPESFETFFDAIYWACISLTTVGYGDIYPVTVSGRIVTMLSSIVGIAIVALPSGIITAGYMSALNNDNATQDQGQSEQEEKE